MKKRILALLLSLVLAISLLPASVFAAAAENAADAVVAAAAVETGAENLAPIKSEYFYSQLNQRAKQIYQLLLKTYSTEATGENAGRQYVDLVAENIASQQDVLDYKAGNKDLFNDFAAAKDALDLDHSELWYLDSSYMSFSVTEQNGAYHVLLGPGRAATYLLAGSKELVSTVHPGGSLKEMDDAVEAAIQAIVDKAKADLAQSNSAGTYSKADQTAALVRSVHDQITQTISYRFETECRAANVPYIRTLYALVTHEGVCEAYARAMQVCLTRLGVECLLVHGLQMSGTPEDHMWNVVRIDDEGTGEARWYAVDATWDDPLTADYFGRRELLNVEETHGVDGKENGTYLLVGQDVVGANWRPSGFVSASTFEFTYPTVEASSYSGSTISNVNGLVVKYSAGSSSLEDGTPAGAFTVSFQGMNNKKAAEAGFFFMLKMYDYHPDGTCDAMGEWYYAESTLLAIGDNNPYFYDREDGLQVYTSTCEYIEVAVTTCKPDHYEEWTDDPRTSYLSNNPGAGFFQGSESDIIAQTGMLYNANASYEAPPYVFRQTPPANCQATAGVQYRVNVQWDDELYHPMADASVPAVADLFEDNSQTAAGQTVRVRYTTYQQDLRTGGTIVAQIAGNLPFDENRDNYVDETAYTDFQWHYVYTKDTCPNKAYHTEHPEADCDVNKGCRIDGVEFNFRASDMWQDDITEYCFTVEGVVGSRSNKAPNTFGFVCQVPGLCPACYRSQGIDWNLWGKPTLLDMPSNLNLGDIAVSGVGSDSESSLNELQERMNIDDMNGRLMLVVEDISKGAGNREEYEKVTGALEAEQDIQEEDVLASSIFEINFNRICPMVKLKPGNSLRVQVGYPAGITYEMLGSEVVLKGYHFTRCDEKNPCGKEKEAGHKPGQDIVSVEELNITPTPYGLVVICNAFSPVELVAVKAGTETAARISSTRAAAAAGETIVVVSGEGGTVSYQDAEGKEVKAVGTAGDIPFTGEDITFKVHPEAGYVVNTISFGGKPITVSGDQFTLSKDLVESSDILNITFIPEEVKTAEVAQYGNTVVASVCTHSRAVIVQPEVKATCTAAGHTAEVKCQDCGQVLSERTEIPAVAHTVKVIKEAKDPTCTEAGNRAETKCTVCSKVLSDGGVIPALGHDFRDYKTEEGQTPTCQGILSTGTCSRCHMEGEVWNRAQLEPHSFIYEVTSKPTCTEDEVQTGTCHWCNTVTTRTVPNTATGHNYADGVCQTCGTHACTAGEHNLQPMTDVAATCISQGHTGGVQCTKCGLITEQPTVQNTIPHTLVDMPEHSPTCTQDGHTGGKKCSVCGEIIVNYTVVPATGHKMADMEPVAATCTTEGRTGGRHCTVCGHIESEPTVVPKTSHTEVPMESVAATCQTHGQRGGTKCSVCGAVITQPELIPATGHTEEVLPGKDATCTAEGLTPGRKCTVCGEVTVLQQTTAKLGHTEVSLPGYPASCTSTGLTDGVQCSVCGEILVPQETIPRESHTYSYTGSTSATCTSAGYMHYSCIYCGSTTYSLIEDALGHNYVNGVCTRCGAQDTAWVPNPDGSKTLTQQEADGSVHESTVYPDGSTLDRVTHTDGTAVETSVSAEDVKAVSEFNAEGACTSIEVELPVPSVSQDAPKEDTVLTLPVTAPAASSPAAAPEITLSVPQGTTAHVEIPSADFGPGTVAVLVLEDGTEKVIRDCAMGENGVLLHLDETATIKIVDNSVSFPDVDSTSWEASAVEFSSARQLFNGDPNGNFHPDTKMNRGMLVTVLHNMVYAPHEDSAGFPDVPQNAYYAEAIAWAQQENIASGGTDGNFHPEDVITREQLVMMLYNYAAHLGLVSDTRADLSAYQDADSISGYAKDAMSWALAAHVMSGTGGNTLTPQGTATRAQAAAFIMNFCNNVLR